MKLLAHAGALVEQKEYFIEHIDATVIALDFTMSEKVKKINKRCKKLLKFTCFERKNRL